MAPIRPLYPARKAGQQCDGLLQGTNGPDGKRTSHNQTNPQSPSPIRLPLRNVIDLSTSCRALAIAERRNSRFAKMDKTGASRSAATMATFRRRS
ncbi:hypothetical protein KCP77_11930 [Salmonella enterica subsp. enterica]|nr:hypothetical protein KCP77_11930 [Salmonella enterica subsp. enterica]